MCDQLTVEQLASFPPNADVFKEDPYHMGQNFGEGWMMLFPHHRHETFKYVIFVHQPSGRRFKVVVPESLIVLDEVDQRNAQRAFHQDMLVELDRSCDDDRDILGFPHQS